MDLLPSLTSLVIFVVAWLLCYIGYLYWSAGPWKSTHIRFWCRFESRLVFPGRLLFDVMSPIIQSLSVNQETKDHMSAVVCLIAHHVFDDMEYLFETILFLPCLLCTTAFKCVKRIF